MKATRARPIAWAGAQAARREATDKRLMGSIGIVLSLLGFSVGASGYRRSLGPWARYQALKAQDENIARYEAVAPRPAIQGQNRRLGRDRGAPSSGPQTPACDGAGAALVVVGFLVPA